MLRIHVKDSSLSPHKKLKAKTANEMARWVKVLAARLDGPRGERRGQTSAGCPLRSTTCHETSFTSPQHRVKCQRENRTMIKDSAAASLTLETGA